MINSLVDLIFKWDRLRLAIFSEVDWYNSISRTLEDPDAMQIVNAMWCEPDGWRGWHIKDDGTYYFHDIPEKGIRDLWDIIYKKEED